MNESAARLGDQLSVRNCRIRRVRLHPSDTRIAISLRGGFRGKTGGFRDYPGQHSEIKPATIPG
jgi:hypothetical protein